MTKLLSVAKWLLKSLVTGVCAAAALIVFSLFGLFLLISLDPYSNVLVVYRVAAGVVVLTTVGAFIRSGGDGD